jgi:hypothetical protein
MSGIYNPLTLKLSKGGRPFFSTLLTTVVAPQSGNERSCQR